ncbi:hypothetical protein FB451DRAFT_1367378 [Mycena latifolia]|nr:hypothetical protein FB451DRAFT_1367378 [Mycena latifolia]
MRHDAINITKSVQTWQGLVTLTRPIKRAPGLDASCKVLPRPVPALDLLARIPHSLPLLERSAARPSKVERAEVLLSRIFCSDHHHGLWHLIHPPLTLKSRSWILLYLVPTLSVAEAGVVNGWERHRPIVSGLYLESMRAASTPARYAAALSTSALPPPSRVLSRVSARCLRRWRSAESPDLARQVHLHFFLPRFPTTLTQVLIGSHRVNEQGAWSSSILIHTLLPSCTATRPTQPHRRSLYRNCHQAISSLPSPSFGPACSARDGSGEGSATKVAQPSALDSFPKVLKLLRRAKGRRTLVFLGLRLRWCATHATPTSHRVPTWLNAETAAARPRQALSFPIPCGTSTRIPSTLATIVVARRAINVGRR